MPFELASRFLRELRPELAEEFGAWRQRGAFSKRPPIFLRRCRTTRRLHVQSERDGGKVGRVPAGGPATASD